MVELYDPLAIKVGVWRDASPHPLGSWCMSMEDRRRLMTRTPAIVALSEVRASLSQILGSEGRGFIRFVDHTELGFRGYAKGVGYALRGVVQEIGYGPEDAESSEEVKLWVPLGRIVEEKSYLKALSKVRLEVLSRRRSQIR